MSEKHHYFPIFLQRRWAGEDGRVCVYNRPYKEVKALRRHPDAIGFEYDLYTIPGVEDATATHLERRFFLKTDNQAAQALKIIESDPELKLTDALRSGWARFIMSLIYRAPEEIKKYFDGVAAHVKFSEQYFEDNYPKLRRPGDPLTFAEFAQARPSNPAGRAAVLLIERMIDSHVVGTHFVRMMWSVIYTKSRRTFLISDRPIIMTNGLIDPVAHLGLPIGPRKLFIASNEIGIVRQLTSLNADYLVSEINNITVQQARRFVIGEDDSQLRFVANRFGTRKPSIPTETKPLPSPEELARQYGVIIRP